MKARPCLYYRKRYKSYHGDVKAYCWLKPGKRRTLNVCRNCLIASTQRLDGKRTVQIKKPRWAEHE